MRKIIIYTNASEEEDDNTFNEPDTAERDLDLQIQDGVPLSKVLYVLFDGFEDRLKAAGINAKLGNYGD